MANTTAICTSFKVQVFNGGHQFGAITLVSRTSLTAPTTDSFKAALYLVSATYNASTTAYSATGEVSGTNYSAGGVSVTNATAPTSSGTTAFWTPSATITYTTVTLSTAFDSVLLYNSTQNNTAVLVFNFGSTTVTAGTLNLNMPSNAAGTALINLA